MYKRESFNLDGIQYECVFVPPESANARKDEAEMQWYSGRYGDDLYRVIMQSTAVAVRGAHGGGTPAVNMLHYGMFDFKKDIELYCTASDDYCDCTPQGNRYRAGWAQDDHLHAPPEPVCPEYGSPA